MQNDNNGAGRNRFTDGFRIGESLVLPQLNRITNREDVVQVQPKIMDVLVCLAEHSGKVVTKEHFFKTVWAETNVIENVLSRSISDLRKIFKDNPRNPRVIETIPKTGYRLIASIEFQTNGDNPPKETVSETGVSPEPIRQRRLYPGILYGLAALTAAIALLLFIISATSMHQQNGGLQMQISPDHNGKTGHTHSHR